MVLLVKGIWLNYAIGWGTRRAAAPPATCSASSTKGVYIPATAAGAPNVTTECQINVVFNVNATTYFGENIYIIGSSDGRLPERLSLN